MKSVSPKLRWLQHVVKARALGWHMQVNAAFGGSRVLPDFLIVGAMKSGTTSLFSYLVQHPGIVPPRVKEVHFFDIPRNFRRGEAWYRAHFPTRTKI